jgi:hypothetical protein
MKTRSKPKISVLLIPGKLIAAHSLKEMDWISLLLIPGELIAAHSLKEMDSDRASRAS